MQILHVQDKSIKVTEMYDANFTAGGLLFYEFNAIKNLLLSDNFMEEIHKEIENNNLIGIPTMSSRKRVIAEIKRRYSMAPIGFWHYFSQWNDKDMKFGLLYLCFKTYPLVLDIHIEVALKKFKIGNTMNAYDIQMRFDEISSKNDHVAKWSDKTLVKLNVQYRKVLKDTGIYDGNHLYRPVNISQTFWKYFEDLNEDWFLAACFIKN
jgi:hypothetical protein